MDRKHGAFWRFFGGFLIGLGIIIPGISGAAIAMMLGLYQPMAAAAAAPFSNWRQKLVLLLPLGAGAAACLLLFGRLLEYLFLQYSLPTLYAFLGLAAGSLPSMVRSANRGGFRLSYATSFVLCFWLLYAGVPLLLKGPFALVFGRSGHIFQGVLLAAGLVVPGLSASFLLIAAGAYEKLLSAVTRCDFTALFPLGLGLIPSIILISRGVTWLFKRAYGRTSYGILGIVVGSLFLVFPGLPRSCYEAVLCLCLFCGGLWASVAFLKGC